jgi:hypothetical protein
MGNQREKNPWAEKFAAALRQWLTENRMSGADLARQLGILYQQWNSATSGSRITVPDFYARVYCYTGIPEADPRTMPILRRGRQTPVVRALSEEAWQEWMSMYGQSCGADSDLAVAIATDDIAQDIVEDWPEMHKGNGGGADTAQLDALFSDFDALKFQQTLLLLKRQLRTVLMATPAQQNQLLETFGSQLGKLYSLLGVLTIEDPEDRKIALAAQLRWFDSSDKA